MNKQLGLGWEVEIDSIVEQRDVHSARGHIGNHQQSRLPSSKSKETELHKKNEPQPTTLPHDVVFSCARIELTEEVGGFDSGLLENGHQMFDVFHCRAEDNCLFVRRLQNLAYQIQKRRQLVVSAASQEHHIQQLTDLTVHIQAH
jgi:hypothetical protein